MQAAQNLEQKLMSEENLQSWALKCSNSALLLNLLLHCSLEVLLEPSLAFVLAERKLRIVFEQELAMMLLQNFAVVIVYDWFGVVKRRAFLFAVHLKFFSSRPSSICF